MNYYNEIDPFCAQWLQNLMDADVIPRGHIDARSIEDVTPNELAGYTQCHFFAGLGGWVYALDLAGWPRDRPVWTGSCPCQPFSAAGKGAGFEDERHLWPAWQHLIAQCRPPDIFGEQVASKAVDAWIDLVHADLEGMGYAFGSIPFPSAGVGAPHIRDRNYWLAHADNAGSQGHGRPGRVDGAQERAASGRYGSEGGVVGGLADPASAGREARGRHGVRDDEAAGRPSAAPHDRGSFGLAHSASIGRIGWRSSEASNEPGTVERLERLCDAGSRPGATNGHWRDADWLGCRDGKWRPVEARSLALADGLSDCLGLVRAAAEAARKEIDDWCSETKVGAAEALHDVQLSFESEAVRVRSLGGSDGLPSATVLLAFLRKLQAEGWHVEEGVPRSGPQAAEGSVRGVRDDEAAVRPSCERGLDEQQPSEFADVVRVLSSILARHAQATWPQAIASDAEVGFPIGTGVSGRVGRLRAYGNAINPHQAAEFVASYLEATGQSALSAAA